MAQQTISQSDIMIKHGSRMHDGKGPPLTNIKKTIINIIPIPKGTGTYLVEDNFYPPRIPPLPFAMRGAHNNPVKKKQNKKKKNNLWQGSTLTLILYLQYILLNIYLRPYRLKIFQGPFQFCSYQV